MVSSQFWLADKKPSGCAHVLALRCDDYDYGRLYGPRAVTMLE